ncbi:growth-regulating factor 10-like [Mangifera indica]|uniref:growth-regulating factor 10-like n=1 Tax=Mangifera indica TaxID=29780 RepID=UPI001CFAEB6A|nr:growth-regulating factor 10-like [Mangifera indica]
MEPQHPPFEMARSSDMGIGLHSWNMENNGSNRKEKSPPIGLGLELGSGSGKKSTRTTSFGFTIFQHQELHLQSLIYKYLEAGLPVPYHLVIPIWKSVANSSISLSNGVHQLFPSLFGCGSMNLEMRSGFDPEPGRCRRTDGKKWRCSKEAVPDHKYCERHVNRGRHRSRKLVEASPRTHIKTTVDANNNLSISLPVANTTVAFSPKSVLHGSTQ